MKIRIFLSTVVLMVLSIVTGSACADIVKATNQPSIQKVSITSNISLDIYTPSKSPNESPDRTRRYPVFYVMDGQHYFYNAIGFQTSLKDMDISPEYIVVGINTEELNRLGKRAVYLESEPGKLIEIMTSKIIPYVEQHFPANQQRMYFGWQFAAGFGLTLFNQQPELFDGFFLASGNRFDKAKLDQVKQVLHEQPNLNTRFYLTLGNMERHATSSYEQFSSMLEKHGNVRWHYSYFDRYSKRIDHHTTPLESLTEGLAWYFSDYPDLTFYSVQDLQDFGGVEAVQRYYQRRAIRYGKSSTVGEQAKFSMLRHAAEENRWDLFQEIEKATGKHEPEPYIYWLHFFGQFFIANEALGRAETLFKFGISNFPDSHHMWAGLADVESGRGNYQSALENIDKAIELSLDSERHNEKYTRSRKEIKAYY